MKTLDKPFIHPLADVEVGSEVGSNTKVWRWTHVFRGAKIGDNCVLGQNVFVAASAIIGSNVKIQNNVSIYDGVHIEDDVFIGPSVVFTNVINPRAAINRRQEFKKTVIRHGATLGANSTILCGIEVGKFSFVGAGSVVTKNVRDYSLVLGVPARHQGWMSEFGERLEPAGMGQWQCKNTRRLYQEQVAGLVPVGSSS